ncbi:uncharacterized protein [Littorina saxatilis]|uniref:Uncharacterized protein n=1 Tax=Littorina saxatilis TaxID=31220 RepID=A0AAN9GE21_9CAEN
MDRMPNIPTKAELHAQVRCRAEEQKLAEHKEELDKVCYAENRALSTNRHRFVVDRRQSFNTVYNRDIPGIQPHARIRRVSRRESDPEVIEIFRKHEDRRRSLKAADEALSRDAVRRLEREYVHALLSNGGDADAEDCGGEGGVTYPDGLHGVDLCGEQSDAKAEDERKTVSGKDKGNIFTEKDDANADTEKEGVKPDRENDDAKIGTEIYQRKENAEVDMQLSETEISTEQLSGNSAQPPQATGYVSSEVQRPSHTPHSSPTHQLNEDCYDNQHQVPEHSQSNDKPNTGTLIMSIDDGGDAQTNSEKNHSKLDTTSNTDNGYERVTKQITTSVDAATDSNKDRDVSDTRNVLDTLQVPGQTEQTSESGETKTAPKRKRSYSDGNIFFNIYEVKTEGDQQYIVPKTGTDEASKQMNGDDVSADNTTRPGRAPKEGWMEIKPADSVGVQRDETYVIEDEVNKAPSPTRRRFVEVTLTLPDADQTLSPRMTRRQGNVMVRSTSTSDVTTMQRHQGNATPADIKLSPSLKRRLAGPECSTARGEAEMTSDDIRYSLSLTRRIAEVARSTSRMTLREADTNVSPRLPRVNLDPKTSPRLARKDVKGKDGYPRPKPIYKQTENNNNKKPAPKRRPLRRSRSELNFDHTALTNSKTRAEIADVPRTSRRGSEGVEGVTSEGRLTSGQRWDSLMYGLTLSQEEREEISRHKRMQLVTSLRKRQQEVDNDVSRRIGTFLSRFDDA